jgi:choline-sulfatase
MDRRRFMWAGVGTLGAACLSPYPDPSAAPLEPGLRREEQVPGTITPDRPNLLVVTTDDQAQWAAGCYGNSAIHTPNIDRLAAEGMRFTRAFSCPVCSPSRAMTMTGCYNHQVGIEDWISPPETIGLPPHVPILPQELRRLGYDTALFGKWHLGHSRPEFHPTARGFDLFVGMLGGGDEADYMNPSLVISGQTKQFKGALADILADQAIDFLQTYRERPFALFYHPRNPHDPYGPVPGEDTQPYQGRTLTAPGVEGAQSERVREILAKYYASVTNADRNLGRILDALDRLKLADRTVVVFTSDNGYNIGQHGLLHKGNGTLLATNVTRPNIFDTSSAVPLIMRYPGAIRPGVVCEEMVSSIDFFPTALELAGAKRRPGLLFEGMSLVPLLRGKTTVWRDELYLIYNEHHYLPSARMRMIRTRDWKLVRHREEGGINELYDLKKDPGETVNLYGEAAVRAVQEPLERRLTLWEMRTGA